MEILRLHPGDVLELKKPHPCGARLFRVVRVGSEVRIICCGCGRDMVMERPNIERAIRKIPRRRKHPKRNYHRKERLSPTSIAVSRLDTR